MVFKPHLVILSILPAEHWRHSNVASEPTLQSDIGETASDCPAVSTPELLLATSTALYHDVKPSFIPGWVEGWGLIFQRAVVVKHPLLTDFGSDLDSKEPYVSVKSNP